MPVPHASHTSRVSPRPDGFTRVNRRFVAALTRGRGSALLRPYPYGWFDGGCWSLARGVKDWINPRRTRPSAAYAVLAERAGSEHVVLHHVLVTLTTTNGILYVDGDGVTDEPALLRRWRDRERIAAPFLTTFDADALYAQDVRDDARLSRGVTLRLCEVFGPYEEGMVRDSWWTRPRR